MRTKYTLFTLFFLSGLYSCTEHKNSGLLVPSDIEPTNSNGEVNAVIEIPAGTVDKWEMNKESGVLEWETVHGEKRSIAYLGYPGNYGMVPQTLLPAELGGDGDPLDIIVIGPAVARGTVLPCKLLGVLYLNDSGEQDDKLIAVSNHTILRELNTMSDLNQQYPGISEILRIWFTHYKGTDITTTSGFGEKEEAIQLLDQAINAYKNSNENKPAS